MNVCRESTVVFKMFIFQRNSRPMCEYDEAIACQYSICSGDTQECPANLCDKTFYDISHTTTASEPRMLSTRRQSDISLGQLKMRGWKMEDKNALHFLCSFFQFHIFHLCISERVSAANPSLANSSLAFSASPFHCYKKILLISVA